MTETVGIVGLGPMGLAIALRLRDAGFSAVGTSRSEATRRAAEAAGIDVVPDVLAVAERVRRAQDTSRRPGIVITSLPAGPQVRETCLGTGGLLEARGERRLVLVDTSTCAPRDAQALTADLRARGWGSVDAPVSGGPTAARAAALSVMVGGRADDIADATYVLDRLAGRLVVCGGPGAGQVAKACNQLIVTANLVAVAEALVLASSLGADPARVREALLGGYAASRILELHGDRMLRRDFGLGGSVRNHVKDIAIVRSLRDQDATEVFEAAARALEQLEERGGGDLDHSAVVQVVEERLGHTLVPNP
jgi:2-hydroxy-3-oxopropionate reductase